MLRCTRAQELGGAEAGAEFFRQKFRKGYCEVLKFRLRPERHNDGARQVKL